MGRLIPWRDGRTSRVWSPLSFYSRSIGFVIVFITPDNGHFGCPPTPMKSVPPVPAETEIDESDGIVLRCLDHRICCLK